MLKKLDLARVRVFGANKKEKQALGTRLVVYVGNMNPAMQNAVQREHQKLCPAYFPWHHILFCTALHC